MIHSKIFSGKKRQSLPKDLHNYIINTCGDDNIQTGDHKKIDPCLKLTTGCPLMVNNNKHLEDDGCGNGSLCRLISVKLKSGKKPYLMRVDNWKVNTISVSDAEYLLCEHWENSGDTSKKFKVHPQEFTVQIKAPNLTLNNMKIFQFGVNNNRATTGHKLQGMSKDCLFAVNYNYGTENWIYVILSRVREMNGFFSYKKLEISKLKKPDKELLKDERRLKQIEQRVLNMREKNGHKRSYYVDPDISKEKSSLVSDSHQQKDINEREENKKCPNLIDEIEIENMTTQDTITKVKPKRKIDIKTKEQNEKSKINKTHNLDIKNSKIKPIIVTPQKRKRDIKTKEQNEESKRNKTHNLNIIDSNIQPILITPSPISFSEEVTVTRVVGKETSIDSSLNSIITNTGDTICIIFEGIEYDF